MEKLPLSEYPRPQLYRDSYKSLNGYWDYKISKNSELPTSYDGKILVPFSPETKLSGVNKVLQPDEYLFYHLSFSLSDFPLMDKLLLHVLAVDQIAEVFVNGKFIGKHVGGFLPFEFDIREFVNTDKNDLVVRVKDYTDTSYFSRGKQKLKHGGIWYTPQSGIYFPVFLESVSFDYIKNIKFTPDIDKEEIIINIESDAKEAELHIFNMDRPIETNKDVHLKVKDMHLWSPSDPYLYFIRVKTDNDEVTSYFAMRKFSLVKDERGINRLGLNNKPLFMKGVLDQGYYKEGLLTPSSYDDYIKDIELVKSLGFNMIRKHIKIEIPRWYFECDKRGIIVWQDFVNGGEDYKLTTITLPLITGKHHIEAKAYEYEDSKQMMDEVIKCFNTVPFVLLESKKAMGKTSISNKELGISLQNDKLFLRELDVLQPNMIVCTSELIYHEVIKHYKEKQIEIPEHNSIRILPNSGKLVFCSYHPSWWCTRKVYYSVMNHYRAFLKSEEYQRFKFGKYILE